MFVRTSHPALKNCRDHLISSLDSCFLRRRRQEGSWLNISEELSERLGCVKREEVLSVGLWVTVRSGEGRLHSSHAKSFRLDSGLCVFVSLYSQGFIWGSLHLGQLSFKCFLFWTCVRFLKRLLGFFFFCSRFYKLGSFVKVICRSCRGLVGCVL